jgi:rubrerythrin
MYSEEALSEMFQKILKFEQDAKLIYANCLKEVDDKHVTNVLQSISNDEIKHIELANELFNIIDKD